MVFQLGKNKTADDENVRQETFRRWREASLRHQSGASQQADAQQPESELGEGVSDSPVQETQLELGVEIETIPPLSPEPASPAKIPIEEIKMDSMRAVEWPDPRATITLTQEAPPEPPPLLEPRSRVTSLEPARTATAKLAQFVSSGLTSGLTATGLLSAKTGTAKPPAKSNVEVLRTETIRNVADTPLEVEHRAAAPSGVSPVITAPPPAAKPAEDNSALNDDIKRRFGANIRSALGPGTIIEGTFSFDSPVCIDGTLIGEVRSNSVLIVGAQATVNARVKVGSLIVFGTVRGDVESEELVEVREGGLLEGDVQSERFAIEDGGWFQGRCTPTISPKNPKAAVDADQVLVGDETPTIITDKWSIE